MLESVAAALRYRAPKLATGSQANGAMKAARDVTLRPSINFDLLARLPATSSLADLAALITRL